LAYETIDVSTSEAVTVISLNRPKQRNAISELVEHELLGACLQAEADPDVRAIIVRGNGPVFSAGHDIVEAAQRFQQGIVSDDVDFGRRSLHEDLWNIRKPIIAAVHGYVGPHAIHLCVSVDLVIAAEETRFSLEQLKVSVSDSFPLLGYTIGLRHYKEWRLLAKAIDARKAYEWGLVNLVVPREELDETALSWAQQVAATPASGSIRSKLSVNKDFERLGVWELAKLRPVYGTGGTVSERSAEYFKTVAEKGVRAAVDARDQQTSAEKR
jgi:enoyl-CoA hydratase/carnithine racemase